MKLALIAVDGRILEFADEKFPVHHELTWAEVPDDTTADDRYADGKVVKPPQPPEPTPAEKIVRIERENPITHRALRELILTIGEEFPAGKETVFYKRAYEVEMAIRAERAKL